MRLRAAFLATLSAFMLAHPAGAAPAPSLVAGRADGALVSVTLDAAGNVTSQRVLVRPTAETVRIPAEVQRGIVSMLVMTDTRADSLLVDARTGRVRGGYRNGHTGELLISPDGRYHYLVRTDETGALSSLVRTDAHGKHAKTLIAPADEVQLSGISLSPDGKTVYVARTPSATAPSDLYAIDTATGARRTITYVAPYLWLINAVLSPDGKTLAVTFADDVTQELKAGLLDVAGGPVRLFADTGDLLASAFTASGDRVLLTRWTDGELSLATADVTTLRTTPIGKSAGLRNAVPIG